MSAPRSTCFGVVITKTESSILENYKHANIMKFIDFVVESNKKTAYLVTEYI